MNVVVVAPKDLEFRLVLLPSVIVLPLPTTRDRVRFPSAISKKLVIACLLAFDSVVEAGSVAVFSLLYYDIFFTNSYLLYQHVSM